MPDSMKKARPGDALRIPASTYNRFIDAARAAEARAIALRGKHGESLPTGVVVAYNASGEAAPWRGVCEISDTGETSAQVEFVKPGHEDGVGVYGILLEPIGDGKMGRIALSGGPWEVAIAGAVTGDQLGPDDGEWTPTAGNLLHVVRASVDGVTYCFFVGGAAAAALMLLASANMTADDTEYACKYLEADGTQGAVVNCRRPNGIYISSADVGFLGQDSSGQNVFQPANMREEANMPLYVEIRTDDPGGAARIWYRSDL